jgi:carbonic anhydrase
MSATDDLLRNAELYAASFDKAELPRAPALKLAVIACMDARLLTTRVLGLQEGDAHVIRNAGGLVTEDTIRSLAVSQRVLGTREVIVLHHTGCGMLSLDDDAFRRELEEETGVKPGWSVDATPDLDRNVRESVARIKASPFIPSKDSVRGFIYEVETGRLREVT